MSKNERVQFVFNNLEIKGYFHYDSLPLYHNASLKSSVVNNRMRREKGEVSSWG